MSVNPTIDPLVAGVDSYVAREGLIARGSSIVAAVSGGMDSVAMLAVLRELSRRRRWRLIVAHLDHGLRGDSRLDAQFVRRLARRWGLKCVICRKDVGAIARDAGASIELAARRARYEFLQKVAQEHKARYVACAHHADDNVETVLYRILRGTHIRGLCGIPASRVLAEGKGGPVLLVRPMLDVRRKEIEEFCRRRRLSWRTDSTNSDIAYRRNFIRHRLLPMIRSEINPNVDDAVLAVAHAAGLAEGHLASLAGRLLKSATISRDGSTLVLDRAQLRAAEPVVLTTGLREALERMGAPMQAVGRQHLEALADAASGSGPGAVSLPGNWRLTRQKTHIVLERVHAPVEAADGGLVELDLDGATPLADGSTIRCRTMPMNAEKFRRHVKSHPAGRELLDADEIQGRLFCRRRRDGDRFHPLGSGGSKSVSDFLTDSKLPPAGRRDVWCVCDEVGVVWLAPLRIDQRVRVTGRTRRVLEITFPRPPKRPLTP